MTTVTAVTGRSLFDWSFDWCDNLALTLQVLEKGPATTQSAVLQILHCIIHYIDITSSALPMLNGELLRVVSKYVEVSRIIRFETASRTKRAWCSWLAGHLLLNISSQSEPLRLADHLKVWRSFCTSVHFVHGSFCVISSNRNTGFSPLGKVQGLSDEKSK